MSIETIDMTIPAKFVEHIKVFEKIIKPTVLARNKMEAQYRGDFPTKAEEEKFDALNERVEIILELIRLGRETASVAGVCGNFGEEALRTIRTGGDIKILAEKAEKLFKYIKS